MQKKKRLIVSALLFINILMLVVAVVPHHHHFNGSICMKQDIPAEEECPEHHSDSDSCCNHHSDGDSCCHHHHHSAGDSCCNSACMTNFLSLIPPSHIDSAPDYVFVATLFTYDIIEHLLRPQEKVLKNWYFYRESLHDTKVPWDSSLRAPPVV